MLVDNLKHVKMMEEAGFDESQSRTLITIWSSIVELNLATKDDFLLLKKDLEIAFLRERKSTDEKFLGQDDKFSRIDENFNEIDKRFDEIDKRFTEIDKRFTEIDKRFMEVDKRFVRIEKRLDTLEEAIKHLPGKLLNQFIFVAFAMVSSIVALGKLGIL